MFFTSIVVYLSTLTIGKADFLLRLYGKDDISGSDVKQAGKRDPRVFGLSKLALKHFCFLFHPFTFVKQFLMQNKKFNSLRLGHNRKRLSPKIPLMYVFR